MKERYHGDSQVLLIVTVQVFDNEVYLEEMEKDGRCQRGGADCDHQGGGKLSVDMDGGR